MYSTLEFKNVFLKQSECVVFSIVYFTLDISNREDGQKNSSPFTGNPPFIEGLEENKSV